MFAQGIGDRARIARVEEPEPLPQPFGRRDAERRMRFAQGDQLPDVVEQPAVFGFQRPVDLVDGIGRAEAVRFALLVLHHLLAGADEGNALRREQDGVYQLSIGSSSSSARSPVTESRSLSITV